MISTGLPIPDLADRLPFCPRCTYPFTGLPETHQCPECGLPYGSDSQMWVAKPRKWPIDRVIQLISGFMFTPVGIAMIVIGPSGLTRLFTGPLQLTLGLTNFVFACRSRDRWPPFIAIVPDGIWYSTLNMKSQFLPWTRIRSADDRFIGWGIAFTIYLRPRGRVIIRKELRGSMDTRYVIAQINERAQIAHG